MAPFRANGCPFLAAASRAQLRANGLKTFVLSSPAQYRISARDRGLHVFRCICNCKFSKKQHAQPRALLFTKRAEPGQSRACPSALYRRKGEKSTSIFAFPPHFPPAEAAKRRCVRLRGIRRAAAFSLVLNQPSVNHFELLRAAYRGIPCQAVLKPLSCFH